jgi:hypothetical protein
MNRCQQCGQLRTLVWNLQTGRRLCWQCLEYEPPTEPLPPAVKLRIREGVLCLRCVQIEPETMSELYSRLDEELELRLQEAESVGIGFDVPAYDAPKCSKKSVESEVEVAA